MAATDLAWDDLGTEHGVRLRARGHGRDLVVVPGMEGDGTSCLHVVLDVWRALDRQAPTRLVLIDYAAEDHVTLDALQQTMINQLQRLDVRPYAVWGQSFGCLLAATVTVSTGAERTVLVSPFTTLPRSRRLGSRLLGRTPRPLYRITNPPVSRWLFGPVVGAAGKAFLGSLSEAEPGAVARRTGWLDEARDHAAFAAALGGSGPASVWFGSHDRLVDLGAQIDVFTALMSGDEGPRMIPGSGHVVFPPVSVDFLVRRASGWLGAG